MRTDKPTRSAPISYRPPKELEAKFYESVERSGLSVSAFITRSWYGEVLPRQIRRPPIEKKLLSKMLKVLADIRDELRYYRTLESDDKEFKQLLMEIKGHLIELRNAFFQASGRRR